MKVNVEIDCTPAEAREFLGLPDLRVLQASLLKRFEEKLNAGVDALSPENVLQTWFALGANNAQRFQDVFASLLSGALAPGSPRKVSEP